MAQRRSNTQRYLDVLKGIDRKEVQIGVFEHSYYEADDGGPAEPVAAVAATQELGNPQRSIPARPFMRPTFEDRRAENQRTIARGIRAALAGKIGVEAMLSQVGQTNAGAVSQTISRITEPPLAESTIAARRRRRRSPGVSHKPLVDTGLLIQSITSQVVDT